MLMASFPEGDAKGGGQEHLRGEVTKRDRHVSVEKPRVSRTTPEVESTWQEQGMWHVFVGLRERGMKEEEVRGIHSWTFIADMASEEEPQHHALQDEEYGRAGDPDDDNPRSNQADLALLMFRALTLITATAALMCLVVNLISLIRSFRWKTDIFVGILRIYAVVFAAFVAVAETEWEFIFRQWPNLESWVGRGMLQIFVAIMTKALSSASWNLRFEIILHDISAWMLLGCGFIYTLAGCLCLRQLKRKRVQNKHWREQAVKDLQELEKKRQDLQGLLAQGA